MPIYRLMKRIASKYLLRSVDDWYDIIVDMDFISEKIGWRSFSRDIVDSFLANPLLQTRSIELATVGIGKASTDRFVVGEEKKIREDRQESSSKFSHPRPTLQRDPQRSTMKQPTCCCLPTAHLLYNIAAKHTNS